jgi:mycothiol synthase
MTIIRPYEGRDEAALLALWHAVLPLDPINAAVFRTRVLLDPNFQPAGLLLAEEAGEVLAFVLSIRRQVPLFGQGLEPEQSWITAFGVHPARRRQGIGRELLATALARLAGTGCRKVSISPYTPNYFIPGVDVAAYPEAVQFLTALGWRVVSQPIAMQVDLTGFQVPPAIEALGRELAATGIQIGPLEAADLPELMPWIAQYFGWDWYRFAQEYLLELFGRGSDEIGFFVARHGKRIVGYCQQRRERFGPFGVLPELRNRGIGRVMLFRCLAGMPAQGWRCAWFLWTGQDASRVYRQAGFRPIRQFAIMHRELT